MVDAYCRAEAQKLQYIRTHQMEIRADSYSELLAAVKNASFILGHTRIGKRVILPSTYLGSPRALRQN